jgi:hypothetical protein
MLNRTTLNGGDLAALQRAGISMFGAEMILDEKGKDPWFKDISIAMDAQPTLVTTSNAGIPAYLTTVVDPNLLRILTAKNKAAEIFGEEQKGSITDQQIMFPIAEPTVEVSAYGDYSNNGRAGLNLNFPQRQSFLYQVITEYGEVEAERAGLAKISWASEIKEAAVGGLNKYQNLTYFLGVAGLQNYGLLNDPSLAAALTPATKAATGTTWITSAGVINATANEVYADIESIITKLITQSAGLIELDTPMTLAMSPKSSMALTITNSFGLTPKDMLSKSFPNVTIKTAIQYGVQSTQNPQGNLAGELLQVIAGTVEGQATGYCASNVKLRTFAPVRALSSWQQKFCQGTWGAIVRQPFALASMVGI